MVEQIDIVKLVTKMENSSLRTILENLLNKSEKGESDLDLVKKETDQFFLIVVSMLIFFMQCGFAFLEAGSVRSDSDKNCIE